MEKRKEKKKRALKKSKEKVCWLQVTKHLDMHYMRADQSALLEHVIVELRQKYKVAPVLIILKWDSQD